MAHFPRRVCGSEKNLLHSGVWSVLSGHDDLLSERSLCKQLERTYLVSCWHDPYCSIYWPALISSQAKRLYAAYSQECVEVEFSDVRIHDPA
jgi:hypothetical protein